MKMKSLDLTQTRRFRAEIPYILGKLKRNRDSSRMRGMISFPLTLGNLEIANCDIKQVIGKVTTFSPNLVIITTFEFGNWKKNNCLPPQK